MKALNDLHGVSEQERALREALHDLLFGRKRSDIRDPSREIVITPYGGVCGQAGVVIAVAGSPPRSLILVATDRGREGAYVCVFRRPYQIGPAIELDNFTRQRYSTSSKRRQAYEAILDYLTFIRVFDENGNRNAAFRACRVNGLCEAVTSSTCGWPPKTRSLQTRDRDEQSVQSET